MSTRSTYSTRVETWTVTNKDGKPVRVGKVVIRDDEGRFHGATNYRQRARVGQVAKARR